MTREFDKHSPFVLVHDESWDDLAGREDIILIATWAEGEELWVALPQFDIEFCGHAGDQTDTAQRTIQAMLGLYDALREMPESFINDVERAQLRVLEHVLLPWFGRTMARNPGFWVVPTEVLTGTPGRVDA